MLRFLSTLPIIRSLRGFSLDADARSSESLKVGLNVDLKHADVTAEGKNIIGDNTKVSGKLHLGYASTIGRSSHLFGGEINIGRYCQFGPCVGIYAMNHPSTHITSYLNNQLFDGRLKTHQQAGIVSIGNDVWIGHGVVVLPNVVIGDGAIIGAGTVITKDVDDFSVVVGNPGRELRKRFNRELIELIKLTRWWDLSTDELVELEDIFHLDLSVEPEQAALRLRQYLQQRLRLDEKGNTKKVAPASVTLQTH